VNFFFDQFCQHGQGFLAIAPNRNRCFYVLINFGGIDIEMDDLCLLSIFIQSPRYPVIETHTHSNQHIAFIRQHIGAVIAVHT